jgi:hypothetical protein
MKDLTGSEHIRELGDRWNNNIEMYSKDIYIVGWIELPQGRIQWWVS